ncbi:hypothetical protein F5X68DRAFT_254847 [Plectosphaerella plurivora]|uniref:F-box domain-containing protein n=1 Tax=Plectosphaerella plurivora TaxID=936078 RepID=A0A9P8VCL9_9PEZI|nr:hypothetical protein F5X68DRAFT_254847 [Plectosphaerella plurivora]
MPLGKRRKATDIWVEGSDVELEMPGPAQENQVDRPFTPTATHIWTTYHKLMVPFNEERAAQKEKKERRKKKMAKRRREQRALEKKEERAAAAAERKAKKWEEDRPKREKKAAEEAEKKVRMAARAARGEANRAAKAAKATNRRPARAPKAKAKAISKANIDSEYEDGEETMSETEDEFPTPPQPVKRRKTGPFINDSDGDADDEAELQPAFLRLPLEIRELIYIYLLAPDADSRLRVQVCNGWTEPLLGRAHRQLRSQLHPAIMRVNSQIADECVRVLYGRNEFEYCLRDPNVESAEAQEDEERAEDSDVVVDNADADADADSSAVDTESDDDYKEPSPRHKTRAAPRRSAQPSTQTRASAAPYDVFDPSVSINVRKFGHHYRRIRILAEPGRSSPAYRTAMAQAIRVFSSLQPKRARLHTLTIEITPERDLEDESIVSFVDFFEPKGEVIAALRALPCQFIRILVHTDLPNPDTALKETEIVLDLRHAAAMRRAHRGEKDVWQDDHVAMEERKKKATKEQRRMLTLPQLIMQQWEQQELWVDELGRPITREQYNVELAEAEADNWFWE